MKSLLLAAGAVSFVLAALPREADA
jgi:hypothetical protein